MQALKIEANEGRKEDFLKIIPRKKAAHVGVRTLFFDSGNFKIVYIPSLELSAYGETELEATEMVTVVLRDCINNLLNLPIGELAKELKKYGWARKPFMPKQLLNVQTYDIEAIKETFDLPKETQVRQQYAVA